MSAEQTPAIERVLAEHHDYGWHSPTKQFCCSCGSVLTTSFPDATHRAHVAQALAPVLAAAEREAEQRALRDAADEYERMYQQPGSATGADWLRARADRVAEPQHEAATSGKESEASDE